MTETEMFTNRGTFLKLQFLVYTLKNYVLINNTFFCVMAILAERKREREREREKQHIVSNTICVNYHPITLLPTSLHKLLTKFTPLFSLVDDVDALMSGIWISPLEM